MVLGVGDTIIIVDLIEVEVHNGTLMIGQIGECSFHLQRPVFDLCGSQNGVIATKVHTLILQLGVKLPIVIRSVGPLLG